MPLFSIGGKKNKDPMVDIETLLVGYAWNNLCEYNCMDSIFRTRRYLFEVNWSYIDITHRLKSFEIRNRDDIIASSDDNKIRSKVIHRDLCLFRTEFVNNSPAEQSFTFKTERKTTSRCDVSIQKGFRVGAKVDVRLSIPIAGQGGAAAAGLQAPGSEVEGCRVTGELSGELHVTKTTGQTFEETLTWGVDSQIKVEKNSRAVAELMIREEEVMANFKIENFFEATNDIPVYVKDRKTGRILEILEIPKEKLAAILKDGEGMTEVENNRVKCETKGTLRAVYGAEQIINIRTSSANVLDTFREKSLPQIVEA